MKINFNEVDCLEKGLRKILKKNRCLTKKEKKCLQRAIQFFKYLGKFRKRKRSLFRRASHRILKLILKLM